MGYNLYDFYKIKVFTYLRWVHPIRPRLMRVFTSIQARENRIYRVLIESRDIGDGLYIFITPKGIYISRNPFIYFLIIT